MIRPNYPKLTLENFGTQLLETLDLDPVYVPLAKANLDEKTLKRWLIAYWCCYHPGASSWLAEREGRDFWVGMMAMAYNTIHAPTGERWPRGRERRHFRGAPAVNAVQSLHQEYPEPEAMLQYLAPARDAVTSYTTFHSRAIRLPMFGSWISFKMADMMERLLGAKISFDAAEVMMFSEPRAGLKLWYERAHKDAEVDFNITILTRQLIRYFSDYTAPPKDDRPINIQEVETMLCKWKSHLNGNYPVGIDSIELEHSLSKWAEHSKIAFELMKYAPKPPAPTIYKAEGLFAE